MSLFIVGSVSRVTSNIVLELSRAGMYSSITIGDLLPQYQFHRRFYRLQQQMDHLQLSQKVTLQKLHQVNDIFVGEKSHSDVLFVTHDYYHHVTSKTQMMKLTAQACKNRSHVFFATPIEYDHFGFATPEENYRQHEEEIRQIVPNSTIIRSDVQDETETMAYINSSKNIIDEKVFDFYSSKYFAPKVVNSQKYAQIVVNTLKNRTQAKKILIQGPQSMTPQQVKFDKGIEGWEFNHAKSNIADMTNKYQGIFDDEFEKVAEATQ